MTTRFFCPKRVLSENPLCAIVIPIFYFELSLLSTKLLYATRKVYKEGKVKFNLMENTGIQLFFFEIR